MKITILAFNYAHAGRYMNGPGICLFNFNKILTDSGKFKVSIFTELPAKIGSVLPIKNNDKLLKEAKDSDLIIHWSGLTPILTSAVIKLTALGKPQWLGPNLIDCVEFNKEKSYLSAIKFNKILTVNERLKFLIAKRHNLSTDIINQFIIGPDLEQWAPEANNDGTILWKGNSKQFVKDVNFALELRNRLPKYNFKFIGYPHPYSYDEHIADAKKSKLSICTSLSETTGQVVLESWAAGMPTITHPKIYMHGDNYKTGIITSKTIPDYISAIEEITMDDNLYKSMRIQSRDFMIDNFSKKVIIKKLEKLIE